MAKATATWTDTEVTDWEAGDFVRETNLKEQVLQNLEKLGQSHDHSSASGGEGGVLPAADPLFVLYIGPAI